MGREDDAVREAKLGVELMPVEKEAYKGVYRVEYLARVYMMVGEYDAAIDQLDYLLSIPGVISAPLLRIDPTWDPLRDHCGPMPGRTCPMSTSPRLVAGPAC